MSRADRMQHLMQRLRLHQHPVPEAQLAAALADKPKFPNPMTHDLREPNSIKLFSKSAPTGER